MIPMGVCSATCGGGTQMFACLGTVQDCRKRNFIIIHFTSFLNPAGDDIIIIYDVFLGPNFTLLILF